MKLMRLLPLALLAGASVARAQLIPLSAPQPRLTGPAGATTIPVRTPDADRVTPVKTLPPTQNAAAYTPLLLENGAVWTGLSGWYDYQSNGASPQYIALNPTDPSKINVVYMLTLDETDVTEGAPSRRIGYAYSGDAGQNWTSLQDISGFRMGFPSVRAKNDGSAMISGHGISNGSLRSVLFLQDGPGSTTFYPLADLPVATASGRTNPTGGVIWPMFAISNDETKAVVTAGFSPATGQPSSPLQVATVDLTTGATVGDAWRDLTDSLVSYSAGSRSVVARSASGRIGAAWFGFRGAGSDPYGIYFSESTDDGATWSDPVKILDSLIVDLGAGNMNEDPDTLFASSNLDLAYAGDVPHIAFAGAFNNLYRGGGIFHWRGNSNMIRQVSGFTGFNGGVGAITVPRAKLQPNYDPIDYPSISIGNDGQTVLISFSATGGSIDSVTTPGEYVYSLDTSALGFYYYKAMIVGSRDGGDTWGRTRTIQPSVREGDTVSIEYPNLAETFTVAGNGDAEMTLGFQARRNPGMYAFIVADVDPNTDGEQPADRGVIEELGFYVQRMNLDASYFPVSASAPRDEQGGTAATISRVWPNPAGSTAVVEYTLTTSAPADVTVVDMMGRDVVRISDVRPVAGTHTSSLDITSLPTGEYRVVVRQNGRATSSPVSIVR